MKMPILSSSSLASLLSPSDQKPTALRLHQCHVTAVHAPLQINCRLYKFKEDFGHIALYLQPFQKLALFCGALFKAGNDG